MTSMKRVSVLLLVSGVSVFAGGCSHDIRVVLDESDAGLRDAQGALKSIEVNIVGVSWAELTKWEGKSMSAYWEPGDQLRQSADKIVMTFGEGKPTSQTLKSDDPIWKKWEAGYFKSVLILANLPGIKDQQGEADPRRLILGTKRMGAYKDIWNVDVKVLLRSGGMTPMKDDGK